MISVNDDSHNKGQNKMKKQNGNALAKQAPQAITEVPDYLKPKPGVRLGNENVTSEDVIVPRIALAQSNSFELKKSHAKYIEGLEQGEFFNTATKEIYGKALRVINVHYFRSRIRWNGKEIGAGILCRSDDGANGIGDPGGACASCEFSKFNTDEDDSRPSCMMFMNFPCLVIGAKGEVDPAGIVIYSMKSLSIKTGKHWNTLVNIKNLDRFAGVYKLTSVEDHRASGDSFQPNIENDGLVTREQAEAGRISYELINSWRAAGRMPAPESETVTV
jgi:hypothetical protein